MLNVDPDFHFSMPPKRPVTAGTTAFRGLALVCAIGALAGLIDTLVAVPFYSRLSNSILLYSVPALIILVLVFRFRTLDKHATYAGLLAFFLSSSAHASNIWLSNLTDLSSPVEVILGFVRVGLFAIYGLMLIGGFVFLASSDKMAHVLRRRLA